MKSDKTIQALCAGLPVVRASLGKLLRGSPRAKHGAFPDDLEIEDGYPSDDRVDEIACVSFHDADRWLREILPASINALPCGRADTEEFTDRGQRMVRITAVTGGWSGCESIIYAVLDHPVMRMRVSEQHRGGLYVLKVPVDGIPEAKS